MNAEQRLKRAERNRRYYQRRRYVEQVDEAGLACLNGEGRELRRSADSSFILEASDLKTRACTVSDDKNMVCLNEEIGQENEGVTSGNTSIKTFKMPRIKTPTAASREGTASDSDVLTIKTLDHHQSECLNFLRRPQFAIILLSLPLVIATTFCLVSEAYRYYAQHDPAMAPLKAWLGELILLYLSLLAPRQWVHRILVKVLLVMTFGYLAWIISMGLVLRTSGDVNKLTQVKNMIRDVEQQIGDKRSELSELTKSGWISRARKVDEQLTGEQQRLFDLRSRLAEIGSDRRELILGNLVSLVLFRVILMLTNIVLIRNLRCMLPAP